MIQQSVYPLEKIQAQKTNWMLIVLISFIVIFLAALVYQVMMDSSNDNNANEN